MTKPQTESASWYRGRDILVPGGAGFIGGALVRRLCSFGARVTVVDSIELGCGGDWSQLDDVQFAPEARLRCIEARIEAFLERESLEIYEVIFNCIGLTDHFVGLRQPERDYEINCAAALSLLTHLRQEKLACRLVSLGSRNQYGRATSDVALAESVPLAPLDVQSVHKTTLEHYHRAFSRGAEFETIFLRLTNTYGPGQRLSGPGVGFVGEFLRAALNGEELLVYGSSERTKDLLFVEDAVDALMRIGSAEEVEPVYNLGGEPVSIGRMLKAIENESGPLKVKVRPFPEHVREIDTGETCLDSGAIASACGWSPTTQIEEGIARTLAGYRNLYLGAVPVGAKGW